MQMVKSFHDQVYEIKLYISRVVSVGQRIEHPHGALGAAVAGIGAIGGEGNGPLALQFLGRGIHQQPDFPVAGVVAQRYGSAVGGANPAVGAQDQELFAAQQSRVPAHSGVLRPSEQIPRGARQQHFRGNGQRSRRPGSGGVHAIERGITGIQKPRVKVLHSLTIHDRASRWSVQFYTHFRLTAAEL